jgi:non-ribosomal peptide synthetase component E (peptide arylation enzyme)
MEIFVTVIVVLAVIALGVLPIHLLNSQRDERIAAFQTADRAPARPRATGTRPGARWDPWWCR